MIIILKFRIFKISDIDQGINTQNKRNRIFQGLKKFKWKENKSQFYRIQDYVMHTKILNFACKNFFSKNVCLRTKFDLQLKITWKIYCVAIKKMPVIQFPYMGIVW